MGGVREVEAHRILNCKSPGFFLFPAVDLIGKAQRYESHSLTLQL
jgi:hypothetical protein